MRKFHSRNAFKISALALAICGLSSFAQAEESTELEQISVDTGAMDRAATTENTKSFTTTSMSTTIGLALSPKQTPQSVSVITNQQLKSLGIHSINDALKHTTGINVTRNGTRPAYYSRGFQVTQIEQDGIASMLPGSLLNSNDDPQSMSDIAFYDHLEIVRGATGLTQGTGEPGGTINVVRKKPTSETQRSLELSVDRFGALRSVADVSGSLNNDQTIRGRLIAVGEHNRSFKDNVKGNKKAVYGVIDFMLGDSSQLTLGASYQYERTTPDPSGLPMGADRNLGLHYSTFLGADWNKAVTKKYDVFAELDTYLTDDWKWTNRVSYTHSKLEQQQATLGVSSTSYKGVGADNSLPVSGRLSNWKDKGHQFAFQSNLAGKYSLFDRQHDAFLTYTFSRENLHSFWRQFEDTTSYDIYSFNGQIPFRDFSEGPYRFREYDDYTLTKNGFAFGTRFNILDNLHLLAGTRWTNWHSDYDEVYYGRDGVTPNYDPNYRESSRWIPYLGLTWDINDTYSAYVSWTSIFKPSLGGKDKQGKDLPPQIGNNYEAGLKGSWFNNQLNASVALFKILQKNRPITITRAQAQAEDPNATRGYSIASGVVESKGVDVEVSGKLTDKWQLFAGYTFNLSKHRDTESASVPSGLNFSKHTPKHIFRLNTTYDLTEQWTVGGGLDYQSRTSSLYNIEQGGYTLWNASVAYKPVKDLTLSLVARNLFDKRYYENNRVRTAGMNNFYGEPRNFVFSVNYNF